jgi:antitoxin component of RelBE/YafQ-DinJ toxin-antitoxin module
MSILTVRNAQKTFFQKKEATAVLKNLNMTVEQNSM